MKTTIQNEALTLLTMTPYRYLRDKEVSNGDKFRPGSTSFNEQ